MKLTRRTFIKSTTSAAVGLAISPSLIAMNQTPSDLSEIGIILNTVGEELKKDYKSTLLKLKEIGYTYIEGGVTGDSTDEYAKYVKKIGLKTICTGSNMIPLQQDLDSFLRVGDALGVEYITCYYPWLINTDKISKAASLEAAENFNKIGKRCKDAGFKFVFHNHQFEFLDLPNGEKPFDIIMENTDPELLSAQMDVYWVTKGGCDPVNYLKKYPGRTALLHVKDMDNTPEKGFACVGNGIIDFKRILSFAKLGGVKHCIIEHDKPIDGIRCAEVGYNHLKSLI